MFVDTVTEMLPFLALGGLVVATLIATLGALRSSRRAERLGEDRLELLRDQHERLELLRDERRTLAEELELERRERLEAQGRVERLTREHPHLELERELRGVSEELELERKGRLHNHRERERLAEELEEERLARSEDQRGARREIERLEREVRELAGSLDAWEEQLGAASKASKKGLWATLFRGDGR
jgi:hypothetical protein